MQKNTHADPGARSSHTMSTERSRTPPRLIVGEASALLPLCGVAHAAQDPRGVVGACCETDETGAPTCRQPRRHDRSPRTAALGPWLLWLVFLIGGTIAVMSIARGASSVSSYATESRNNQRWQHVGMDADANAAGNPDVRVEEDRIAVAMLPDASLLEQLQSIYCRGPILDAVQRAHLFDDSKYFVDMPIKATSSPQQILTEFASDIAPLVPSVLSVEDTAYVEALKLFVDRHFDEPGLEVLETVPADYVESPLPPQIAGIRNQAQQDWALELHKLWKVLGRAPNREILSSYLHPTPVADLTVDGEEDTLIVVPGGRFRESYYWDSYWIVEGLMVSNMRSTARRVIKNLLEYVVEHRFVPNGGRIYYLTRSQPPLLSDMVRLVAVKHEDGGSENSIQLDHEDTSADNDWDCEYLAKVLPILEREYEYWMSSHAVEIMIDEHSYTLNQYTSSANVPRPESYREDVLLAEIVLGDVNDDRRSAFYNDIIAAAESGWDFSSRWFADHSTLVSIVTRNVIPVDLNAIMYRVENNLAMFHRALGNIKSEAIYRQAAVRRLEAIHEVLWHSPSYSWRDFIISKKEHSPVVAASNYFPLWAQAYTADRMPSEDWRMRIVNSFRESGLVQVAGVQTTTLTTAEQWDAPNAWPPLQDILIEGLLHLDTPEATTLAHDLVRVWVNTCHAAWNATGSMFEKYNATVVGDLGRGGEYVTQLGFGWTNGVVLKFLTKYKNLFVSASND